MRTVIVSRSDRSDKLRDAKGHPQGRCPISATTEFGSQCLWKPESAQSVTLDLPALDSVKILELGIWALGTPSLSFPA